MKFMIGDHVQLKSSDGPCMTVIGGHPNGHCTCCWFDGTELQEMLAPTESLMICTALDENARILKDILQSQ